jgi:predicted acyltransferase
MRGFLLRENHLYHKSPVDPEVVAATMSALAHTIIGFCCGAVVRSRKTLVDRTVRLFVIGFTLMAAGFMLSEWMPLNKRIWSPTFVLVTTGLA